jgi:hypothetical protein
MRRRSVLGALGGGLALLAAAGWRTTPKHTLQEVVVAVLRQRLPYLRLEEEGLKRFAIDLVKNAVISPLRLRTLGALLPVYQRVSLSGEEQYIPELLHGEERITTLYLISSDFFQNHQREDREIRYLGYYDPLIRAACSSPLARPIYLSVEGSPGDKPTVWPPPTARRD